MKEKQTAVEWFFDKIKSHFEHNGELLESLTMTRDIAKQKEREQHGNTWDTAIEAYEDRGHVLARAITDFDDYTIK